MKFINHIKAGAKVAPAFLIFLYYFFVALDLYTTYLASPDLKYERNWIVQYFNLSWSQIIILGSLNALIAGSFFLIALSYIYGYYQDNNTKYSKSFIFEIFQRKKLLICFIMLVYFYSHLFASVFVTINNYLNYIYLSRIENVLSRISNSYINIEIVSQPTYFLYIKTVLMIAAIIFTVYKVKKIRDKYRALTVEK